MGKRKARKSASRRSKSRTTRRKARKTASAKLPKHAVTLIVILRAKEGQETLLEAELRSLVGPTRKEEGCLVFDLHRSVEAPAGFLLHEVWARQEHHLAHTNTAHFLRWNARKDSLIASRDSGFWQQIA